MTVDVDDEKQWPCCASLCYIERRGGRERERGKGKGEGEEKGGQLFCEYPDLVSIKMIMCLQAPTPLKLYTTSSEIGHLSTCNTCKHSLFHPLLVRVLINPDLTIFLIMLSMLLIIPFIIENGLWPPNGISPIPIPIPPNGDSARGE